MLLKVVIIEDNPITVRSLVETTSGKRLAARWPELRWMVRPAAS